MPWVPWERELGIPWESPEWHEMRSSSKRQKDESVPTPTLCTAPDTFLGLQLSWLGLAGLDWTGLVK
jgi:hypothetical protein